MAENSVSFSSFSSSSSSSFPASSSFSSTSTSISISVSASSPMAAPPSSPRALADQHHRHHDLLSSPPPAVRAGKERRQASITPRKFRRFFTPRARVSSHPSAARQALRDMTARALNQEQTATPPPSSPLRLGECLSLEEEVDDEEWPTSKRRKTGHFTPPNSSPVKPQPQSLLPLPLTPVRRSVLLSPLASSPVVPGMDSDASNDDMSEDDDDDGLAQAMPVRRAVPLTQRGVAGQLLQRELGCLPGGGHQLLARPLNDLKIETADFCSSPQDVHACSSHETPDGRCIPFCSAPCHNNSIVAVGDEEGHIRLLDTDAASPGGLDRIHLSFAAHSNAVIDLAFSDDDLLLATASGDQTGKVIDVMTQTPIAILDHHTASLKQVRFQPGRGNGNVLATSGRDGCVKIWDLRCKGGPAQEMTVDRVMRLRYNLPRQIQQGCVVNSINDAHARTQRQARQLVQAAVAATGPASRSASGSSADVVSRYEVPGRAGEVSVTAIQFLAPGREHLLLSACEADAAIKVWDIRNVHSARSKSGTPMAVTAPPESHSQWRPFGISSMALGSDGARLYALCKDNTVYAYSTAHLALGCVPELSAFGLGPLSAKGSSTAAAEPPRRRHGPALPGLGPLYGFRHESFHATSFYVKAAVRPAMHGRSELLAVGSSDGCSIVFATDERYLRGEGGAREDMGGQVGRDGVLGRDASVFSSAGASKGGGRRGGAAFRPGLFRTADNSRGLSGQHSGGGGGHTRLVDTVPIVRNGTALVRGHEQKEVGAVCWTSEGHLVSLGDDYLVRCWREDRSHASRLRTGGEAEGQRWGCGWADVDASWDEDEWMEE